MRVCERGICSTGRLDGTCCVGPVFSALTSLYIVPCPPQPSSWPAVYTYAAPIRPSRFDEGDASALWPNFTDPFSASASYQCTHSIRTTPLPPTRAMPIGHGRHARVRGLYRVLPAPI